MNDDLSAAQFAQWISTRNLHSKSRQLLVLSNTATSLQEPAQKLSNLIQTSLQSIASQYAKTLYVGNFASQIKVVFDKSIPLELLKQELGEQYNAVVLDCREGWQPNHIYSASGLIEAPGLLVILTPAPSTWAAYYAAHKLVSFSYGDGHQHSFFADYLHQIFTANKGVAWHSEESSVLPLIQDNTKPKLHTRSAEIALSDQQHSALLAISRSWDTQANSCHFITGARGRGKTTLLSKLCEYAVSTPSLSGFSKLAICAPSAGQRDIVARYISLSNSPSIEVLSIAPDQAEQLNAATLLLIDEAASIAPELLNQLCNAVSHVIISATTQGYEGSGKGLIYRWLPSLHKPIEQYDLTQPFRWGNDDALEALIEETFQPEQPAADGPISANFKLVLLNKTDLLKNTELLKACIALLQQAHYQSTPNDILRILDAQDHGLWAYINTSSLNPVENLYGVICTIIEGGENTFDEPALCEAIATGQRRVQGHMSLQALTMSLHRSEILAHKTCRIHRIAVRTEVHRKGIGSRMLRHLYEQKITIDVDGFSSSFGLTAALHHFWQKNGYELVKLGHRKDTSSGTITGHFLDKTSRLYSEISDSSLSLIHLDKCYLVAYEPSFDAFFAHLGIPLHDAFCNKQSVLMLALKKLNLFLTNKISYAMAKPAIYFAVLDSKNSLLKQSFNKLHEKHLTQGNKQILERKIRKALINYLKDSM
ncbi:GNAT family N-acetyltransferase [Glaciecola sp. SC05]|uniref:GNAT family N-acetyltransferase n=1 Tax=Glaciecola sp. SC05 TaxID=1987355 RepID=UPI003528F617